MLKFHGNLLRNKVSIVEVALLVGHTMYLLFLTYSLKLTSFYTGHDARQDAAPGHDERVQLVDDVVESLAPRADRGHAQVPEEGDDGSVHSEEEQVCCEGEGEVRDMRRRGKMEVVRIEYIYSYTILRRLINLDILTYPLNICNTTDIRVRASLFVSFRSTSVPWDVP